MDTGFAKEVISMTEPAHLPAGNDSEAGIAALEKLAAELGARGFETRLLAPEGWRPSLAVRNPRAPMLSETILAQAEWFWWPWADRIAEIADVAAAADKIGRVLAVVPRDASS
jgi:hypothetical protein